MSLIEYDEPWKVHNAKPNIDFAAYVFANIDFA